jgi:methylmalonyl-CoA mutase N-terminal domain/subunit
MERTSGDGFPAYADSQLTDFELGQKLGEPGKYPFNNGVYPRVTAGRSRIRRPYATARASGRAISALKSPAEGNSDARRDIWGEYRPGTI